MPNLSYPRNSVRELEDIDGALRAALGAAYVGASRSSRELLIHLAEGADTAAAGAAVDAALATIDRARPAPSVRRAQRQQSARAGVTAADFAALQAANAAANSIPALRQQVALLTRLVYQLAAAQGMTDADDPGA